MIKGLAIPVIKYLHGFLILMSLAEISHSMDGDETLYKEDSQPMKRENKSSSVHASREQFWEVNNLEITLEEKSEIAGPIILISTPISYDKTSDQRIELIKKIHNDCKGDKPTYDESVLNDAFENLCKHLGFMDPELKKILLSKVRLKREIVFVQSQNADQYSVFLENYFMALSHLFNDHINYCVGKTTSHRSLIFDFQQAPLHISKSTFKWAEYLDIYLPRKYGSELYYDAFMILANCSAIDGMEIHHEKEGSDFINTLYLKLIHTDPNTILLPKFIYKGFDKENKNLDSQ